MANQEEQNDSRSASVRAAHKGISSSPYKMPQMEAKSDEPQGPTEDIGSIMNMLSLKHPEKIM